MSEVECSVISTSKKEKGMVRKINELSAPLTEAEVVKCMPFDYIVLTRSVKNKFHAKPLCINKRYRNNDAK